MTAPRRGDSRASFGDGIPALERALTYPYERPSGSFVFVGGDPDEARTPVVAYGSNAAAVQLRDKFREDAGVVIPTIRVELVDLDVVYAPLVSYYGAIPATLAVVPGVRSEAWLQLLPDRLLERMHASEGRGRHYDYGRLLEPDGARRPDDARVYWSCDGCLVDEDGPIPIAAIAATGRTRRAMDQRQVQAWAQAVLGEAGDLEAFVREGIAREEVRSWRRDGLLEHARPRDEARFDLLPPGAGVR